MDDEAASVSERAGLVALATFYGVWSLRATTFYFIDVSITFDFWHLIYSATVKLSLWSVPAVAFVHWLRHAPFPSYLRLSENPTRRDWGVAVLVRVAARRGAR